MIQVEDSEENDHDVDHEEITTSESSSEDTGSNNVYRESGGEDEQYEKTGEWWMIWQ